MTVPLDGTLGTELSRRAFEPRFAGGCCGSPPPPTAALAEAPA